MKTVIDEFADIKVMRFDVPGWDSLSLRQKAYAYHLSEAAKLGRDITWDQYCKWNLPVRHLVEDILDRYPGDRECEDFKSFVVYAKRLFFSGGIHHHYSENKFFPACDKDYFRHLVRESGLDDGGLIDVIYSPGICPVRRSVSSDGDIVALSSVNFYDGVSRSEAEGFYASIEDPDDPRPVSAGLNTKLVKEDGREGLEVRRSLWPGD